MDLGRAAPELCEQAQRGRGVRAAAAEPSSHRRPLLEPDRRLRSDSRGASEATGRADDEVVVAGRHGGIVAREPELVRRLDGEPVGEVDRDHPRIDLVVAVGAQPSDPELPVDLGGSLRRELHGPEVRAAPAGSTARSFKARLFFAASSRIESFSGHGCGGSGVLHGETAGASAQVHRHEAFGGNVHDRGHPGLAVLHREQALPVREAPHDRRVVVPGAREDRSQRLRVHDERAAIFARDRPVAVLRDPRAERPRQRRRDDRSAVVDDRERSRHRRRRARPELRVVKEMRGRQARGALAHRRPRGECAPRVIRARRRKRPRRARRSASGDEGEQPGAGKSLVGAGAQRCETGALARRSFSRTRSGSSCLRSRAFSQWRIAPSTLPSRASRSPMCSSIVGSAGSRR